MGSIAHAYQGRSTTTASILQQFYMHKGFPCSVATMVFPCSVATMVFPCSVATVVFPCSVATMVFPCGVATMVFETLMVLKPVWEHTTFQLMMQ